MLDLIIHRSFILLFVLLSVSPFLNEIQTFAFAACPCLR
jgi:hypothetical protein